MILRQYKCYATSNVGRTSMATTKVTIWGLALGDFKGGGIWVLDEGGAQKLKLKEDVKGPRGNVIYKSGTRHCDRVLNTNRNPHRFDVNKLHYTMPITSGDRYAIIYFCQKISQRTHTRSHVRLFDEAGMPTA